MVDVLGFEVRYLNLAACLLSTELLAGKLADWAAIIEIEVSSIVTKPIVSVVILRLVQLSHRIRMHLIIPIKNETMSSSADARTYEPSVILFKLSWVQKGFWGFGAEMKVL